MLARWLCVCMCVLEHRVNAISRCNFARFALVAEYLNYLSKLTYREDGDCIVVGELLLG